VTQPLPGFVAVFFRDVPVSGLDLTGGATVPDFFCWVVVLEDTWVLVNVGLNAVPVPPLAGCDDHVVFVDLQSAAACTLVVIPRAGIAVEAADRILLVNTGTLLCGWAENTPWSNGGL